MAIVTSGDLLPSYALAVVLGGRQSRSAFAWGCYAGLRTNTDSRCRERGLKLAYAGLVPDTSQTLPERGQEIGQSWLPPHRPSLPTFDIGAAAVCGRPGADRPLCMSGHAAKLGPMGTVLPSVMLRFLTRLATYVRQPPGDGRATQSDNHEQVGYIIDALRKGESRWTSENYLAVRQSLAWPRCCLS
jgi:hypothetical protein